MSEGMLNLQVEEEEEVEATKRSSKVLLESLRIGERYCATTSTKGKLSSMPIN